MAKQRNALRAGIFMLVSMALVIFVVIAISGMGRFTQKFESYPVIFGLGDDIGGLRVGDDVRIGGLKVGSITDIKIRNEKATSTSNELPSIIVTVDLPERYHIFKDASVTVQKGLTGAATINFDFLGSGQKLAASDYLQGKPDPFSAFTHQLGDMAPDLKVTVANLRATSVNLKEASPKIALELDRFGTAADSFTETGHEATATVKDLRGRLPDIIDRYKDVTAAAVKALDAIRDFMGPSSGDFHTTVANLSAATGTIKDRLPGLLKQVDEILHKLDDTMMHANAAVTQIQKAVDNARDLTGAARGILVDNKGKFDDIISSFRSTSENLKYASSEIRHSPWRLLYQPKPGEVSNMEIYDSMRQFAEGADSLDNAATALRDAIKDKDADPVQVKKLMDQLNDSFTHFQEVQQKLWKEVKD